MQLLKWIKVKPFIVISTFISGIINGLLGTGGGILLVNVYTKNGDEQKLAQSRSLSMVFFFSLVSVIIYSYSGNIEFSNSIVYIIGGGLGAVIGTFLLPIFNNLVLKRIFALFAIYAGIRFIMLF